MTSRGSTEAEDRLPEVELRSDRLLLRRYRPADAPAVAEKAGMTREGVARNAGFTNTGRVDLVVFSFVPADLSQETGTLRTMGA